jgi:hypothetical protein
MPSAINETVPVAGTPTTASVRSNFLTAKNEITALQSAIPPGANTMAVGISAGGLTQASATLLTSEFNVITFASIPGASVALRQGGPGVICQIKNASTNPIQVWPRSGDGARINTGAADAADELVIQPGDAIVAYKSESVTQWHR